MKRLLMGLALCLCLTGCVAQMDREEAFLVYDETRPVTGVYADTSHLTAFQPPQEVCTRRSEERMEELMPGDYGLLRPYIGSRAAFDMTIYGDSGIYSGNLGLIDDTGAIVVDPVYTDVTLLYDWSRQDAPGFYRLSKEIQKDGWMEQIYGFCSLDGSVAQPCIYESVNCQNGYIVAVQDSGAGLFHIFDTQGNLLLDSASWPQRPAIYMEMGYGTLEVSEKLLFMGVADEQEEYGMDRRLYNWQGELLSEDYDWVILDGDAPYSCGNWEGENNGYLDERGNLLVSGYSSTDQYYFGQALVTRNGQRQVIDRDGNVLWNAPEEHVYTFRSDTTVYYQQEADEDMQTISYRYYSSDFQPLYPEADHVSYLYDDWFLVWQDGVGTVTDGTRSGVLEGAVLDQEDYYYAYDAGAEELLLITTWKDSVQEYWLFDGELTPLSHGSGENPYVELLTDRTDGSAVAVTYERMTYPYRYTVLDYPGAPELPNVDILGVYGGWYMVEDEFSAGYMDTDGNWLFRVNLMTDMTD